MFVGEENGFDPSGIQSGGREAGHHFARTQARVDQHHGVARAENRGIPATAAAEHDEFHGADANGEAAARQMSALSGFAKRRGTV
jgi:hypothetical protein